MSARTRAQGSASGEDGDNNLPPPSSLPPSVTEFFAELLENQRAMEETLRHITQNTTHVRQQHQGPEPNQYSSFKDFLDTKPPIFMEAEEPLQADEWLNTIEQRFRLLRCAEQLKAHYASQQLLGPAGIWWTNYLSTLPAGANVSWDQFKTAFRGHHMPSGLMRMKAAEFMKLTQGTKTLIEYMHAFNNLSRYAPEFVNTEEKRIESFKQGLSIKLMKTMANSKCRTYNEFVSDAFAQENQNNMHSAAKNHKRAFEAGTSQQRAQYHPPTGTYRPPQKKAQPNQQQKVYRRALSIALPKGNASQGSSEAPKNNILCFNFNKPDHFARNYPYPQKGNNQNQGNQSQASPNARYGCVHYTTIEEIPEGEPITTGSPKGLTLLELETVGEEIPPEVQEEGQVQELLECQEHVPTSFVKDGTLYYGYCKNCFSLNVDEE